MTARVEATAPTALVTGGNRGLGLEVARRLVELGHQVVLTGRDLDATTAAAEQIGAAALPLDVADPADIARLARTLGRGARSIDVLVNNAGINLEDPPLRISEPDLSEQMATNLYGPWLLMRALVPAMVARGYGRVVNVSSESASFGTGGPTGGAYGVSKAALNALTVTVAAEVPPEVDVLVNAVDPGWVRTEMGGPDAPRTVEQGTESILWAATLATGGPRGGFFRDGEPLPW
ncbi:MAG TPA: SDR family NAD(P)-dependent oxidoreductase [Candidatus Nanopelagicales bacterium]|jgi:NAD(P)-dependent dehydrogenase (short-subunit alcohol dehydrogenase family)|nr:SDR family NAD(P)-dependent oxidoreductase [Candidatus Nanopelagicales bacterium]